MTGQRILLRALEPQDIDFLYAIENDIETWRIGDSLTPISKHILKQYIEHSHLDIYTLKQVRFVIVDQSDSALVGTIDLFDFDPFHRRAAIGILIDQKHRNKGYADESLMLIEGYARTILQLHQIYAEVALTNKSSISLFEKHQFKSFGTKKDWRKNGENWIDIVIYQKIFTA